MSWRGAPRIGTLIASSEPTLESNGSCSETGTRSLPDSAATRPINSGFIRAFPSGSESSFPLSVTRASMVELSRPGEIRYRDRGAMLAVAMTKPRRSPLRITGAVTIIVDAELSKRRLGARSRWGGSGIEMPWPCISTINSPSSSVNMI